MPYMLHTGEGRVTALIGSAQIRGANGKMRPLRLGDVVYPGDLLLTTQDGIVQVTPEPVAAKLPALPVEIAQTLAALEKDVPQAAPAAAPLPDDGSLTDPGLRVSRIDETLLATATLPASPSVTERAPLTEPVAAKQVVVWTGGVVGIEEGPSVSLGLALPTQVSFITTLAITHLPTIGQILKADGTVLAANTPLLPVELPGLRYLPPSEYDGHSPVGDFAYAVGRALGTETATVHIAVIAINDRPMARPENGVTPEDISLPVALTGQDVDGQITSVTVQSLPIGSHLFLADGTSTVQVGQALSAAQAATLLWRPAQDVNGPADIVFTVTDDGGSVSAPAHYPVTVKPVNDAPVARADADQTLEDQSLSLTLVGNDSDVDGDPLKIVALNGQAVATGQSLAIPEGLLALNANGTLRVAIGHLEGLVSNAAGTTFYSANQYGIVHYQVS